MAYNQVFARIAVGGLALAVVGCQSSDTGEPVATRTSTETAAATCKDVEGAGSDSLATYRTKGNPLVGDVDADGTDDRVTLRIGQTLPPRCRHLLVVQTAGGATATAAVPPLPWPGTDPQLLLLVELDGRPGVEPVIAMSPAGVYRPGAVFTLSQGELARMRLERTLVPELFPFYDEFPAGSDCAGQPGTIVVTHSQIAEEGDRYWDVTRTMYRATGARFRLVRDERFQVEVGPEALRRWPEVRGAPFLHCQDRVG